MPENLWKLRARKGYSLPQLAAKSGIPQQLLFEYEQGKPLKPADQLKLARALYVQPTDIELVSTPQPPMPPVGQRAYPSAPARPAGQHESREPREPRETRDVRPPMKPRGKPVPDRNSPARATQIEHLQHMVASRGHTLEQLLATVGKPLESLTLEEASKWNLHYRDMPRIVKARTTGNSTGVRRAALPEGLDKFEHEYLNTVQQAQGWLSLTLFNGEQMSGQLIGFSLYTFVLRQENGHEVTVQKLAIAYYTRVAAQPTSGGTP